MYIEKGDMSEDVSDLQEKLISLGYSCGAGGADGEFGDDTFNAVVQFQRDHGLDADGIVGDQTWSAITAELNGGSFPLLQKGASGSSVVTLQKKLIVLGYNVGPDGADGDYGDNTVKAVTNFQKDHGLEVDGIAGPNTWTELNAAAGGGNSSLLKVGSKGDEVKRLQSKLIMLGYGVGPDGADGDFGQNTSDAVIQFQRDFGLAVDGIAGPNTWAMLDKATSGVGFSMLKMGASGSNVVALQEKLLSLGYTVGPDGADGDFGQNTYDAVVDFQKDHGLEVDGIVGPNTWAEINATIDNGASSLLRMGSKGDSVRILQEDLIAIGYSCGDAGADGDFGQGTYNAVVAFQKDHNLEVDGIVGPNTWVAINTAVPPDDANVPDEWCVELIANAEREIGYHETGVNQTKYGQWYADKYYPYAPWDLIGKHRHDDFASAEWCAEFVSWCANQTGLIDKKIPHFAYCPDGVNWYKKRNRFQKAGSNYTPYAGDIFFGSNPGSNKATHAAIIVAYDPNTSTIYSVDGNWSDQVCVNIRSLSDKYVYGFGVNGSNTLGVIPQ